MSDPYGTNWKKVIIITGICSTALFVFIAALLILIPIYNRYQARANANNNVTVNNTRIRYYEQQKGIAQQEADIRFIHSTGIRRAQDEIARTLTPLYVQWEAIQAMMAHSGGQTIYIPVGANGVPLVSVAGTQVAKP